MRIPKRMALAISGTAFAGATALALGAAAPAGAQAVTTAPHHAVSGHVFSHITTDGWGWGWDDGGWGDGDWGWDDGDWGC
ncbi:hypothetical protein NE236_40690 [Actinoallomurus purpureus]|uniref:hypothetical protein n=1 Tax=Actinoallomurus purpureus TaxID=478114 RepID=UPI0020934B1A|nr:hypothetical protein [Actinoallomurus purpureus]MCO6011287.1 hypothetical protein [Actinoallomurus purpureus]